jgi:hypothetical protein
MWIPSPSDFKLSTVAGKGYDSEEGTGRELWEAVDQRLKVSPANRLDADTATLAAIQSHGYGKGYESLKSCSPVSVKVCFEYSSPTLTDGGVP